MMWFGPTKPTYFDDGDEIAAPVGTKCLFCPGLIEENENGWMMPYMSADKPPENQPVHHVCLMKNVLGPNWREFVHECRQQEASE